MLKRALILLFFVRINWLISPESPYPLKLLYCDLREDKVDMPLTKCVFNWSTLWILMWQGWSGVLLVMWVQMCSKKNSTNNVNYFFQVSKANDRFLFMEGGGLKVLSRSFFMSCILNKHIIRNFRSIDYKHRGNNSKVYACNTFCMRPPKISCLKYNNFYF